MSSRDAAIREFIASRPLMHESGGERQDWGLEPAVLTWLAERVQPNWRTLETGCGHSSVVFALTGASHTIVAPYDLEHERVREWCRGRGFATDNVRSVIEHSQRALPELDLAGLDLALIDGSHAFPTPLIDWYYTAVGLRVGGYVLVDDTQIRGPRLLFDFLRSESTRWRLDAELGKTAIFAKLDPVVIPENDWIGQPWSLEPADAPPSLDDLGRDALRAARSALRPRIRWRQLRARGRWG